MGTEPHFTLYNYFLSLLKWSYKFNYHRKEWLYWNSSDQSHPNIDYKREHCFRYCFAWPTCYACSSTCDYKA